MELQLFDAHCHLDLMSDPNAVAHEAATMGLELFDCGVDPRGFAAANKRASSSPNVIAGVGLHPWWIADGRCGAAEVDLLCELATRARSDSISRRASRVPRGSRRRHLNGSAKLYRSAHSQGAFYPFMPFARREQLWTFWSRTAF